MHITSPHLIPIGLSQKHHMQVQVWICNQAMPYCTVLFAQKVPIFWLCFHPSPSHPLPRDITFSSLLNISVPVQPCGFWNSDTLAAGELRCDRVSESVPFHSFVFQVTSVHQSSFAGPLAVELSHSSLLLLSSFASKWCYVASLFPHHSWFHAFEWWACGKAIEGESYRN